MPTLIPPSPARSQRHRQPRQPAPAAAVERRRIARRLRSTRPRRRGPDDRDRELAARMARRFHPEGGAIDVMLLDVRYWQARRCGWDAQDPALRTVGRDRRTGEPLLVDPAESVTWRWWCGLHPKVRNQLVKLSDFKLTRAMPLADG